MSDSDALFHDVHAYDKITKDLAVRHSGVDPTGEALPAAVERGRRTRPDGTTEDYERIEFRDKL